MSEIAREACNLVRGILTSTILSGVLAVVVGVVILAWTELKPMMLDDLA
jgi:hypothetical protein